MTYVYFSGLFRPTHGAAIVAFTAGSSDRSFNTAFGAGSGFSFSPGMAIPALIKMCTALISKLSGSQPTAQKLAEQN